MPEVVAVLVGIPLALIIGAALVYIFGFIVSMIVAMFVVPIEAAERRTHRTPRHHRPVIAGR